MSIVYGLIDRDLISKNGIDIEEFASFLESLHISIAQYRNKNPDGIGEILDDIKTIKSMFSGKLIINDYIDFIDLADGLHLGQDDLKSFSRTPSKAIEKVRGVIGKKILGLSTHNLKEIEEANLLDLDYIGLGAYRATSTKDSVLVSGDKLLEYAKSSKHPVAVIGGVMLQDSFPKEISMRVVGGDLVQAFKEQG